MSVRNTSQETKINQKARKTVRPGLKEAATEARRSRPASQEAGRGAAESRGARGASRSGARGVDWRSERSTSSSGSLI